MGATRRIPAEAAFWVASVALLVVMAVGTAPTALWPLYQEADGLSDTTISILAGAIVIGATVSFLALGHLSDRYGRRRVLVPAVLTSATSVALIALVPTVPGMLGARILTGVGLGVVAPTATAYLLDLHRAARPEAPSIRRPATVATAANLGGLALGPVLAGGLAQFFPAPLHLAYGVLAGLLCLAAALLTRCPETVVRSAGEVRRARFDLLPGAGLTFWGGATGGFVSFATSGAVGALGAVVLHEELDVSSTLVWGASIGIVHLASALAQIAAASWTPGRLFAVGGGLLAGGLALMVAALADPTVWMWMAGCTVIGASCGLLFKAALVISTLAAQPSGRAGVLAVFFTVAYLGMALGGVALALLRDWTAPTTALAWLSAGLCAVALVGGLAGIRRPARP